MLFADYNMQEFDWWHAEVPEAYIPYTDLPESFEHLGLLENKTLNLGMTIGLNDYWNVTLSQVFSERCMIWDGPVWESESDEGFNSNYHQIGDSKTVHHRAECSDADFIGRDGKVKAYGGTLGDTNINFKYLLNNAGKKPWEIKHLATMDLWKFGDFKHYTSLEILTHIFKIPTPKDDIDGSQVDKVYYEDKDIDRIVNYCEKDVVATIQLFRRYQGESLINEEMIHVI